MEIKNQLTLSAEEFARWILLNLKCGDSVAFALNRVSKTEVENWWYAKLIDIPERDATIFVIDYYGGGYATAFSIDGDDEFLIDSIVYYFERHNDYYNDDDKITIDLDDIKRGGKDNA